MARRTIPVVIEPSTELDPTKRFWKLALYNPDGTPFSGGSSLPEGGPGVLTRSVEDGEVSWELAPPAEIVDGSVTPAKLTFDPATQTELNAVNNALDTRLDALETAPEFLSVDAGTDLDAARPSASVVYWRFDTGVDPGEDGANVENAIPGDLIYVASA